MKYPTIRIEGSILSADILDKIQQGDLLGQKPKDFWLEGSGKVKDEIVKAWADAQDMWRIYQRKIESIPDSKTGTTETRNFWMVPLLSLLGYDMQLYRTAQNINNKSYAISHNASNLDNFPIHIMGFNDSLDKKRVDSGPRMSPHALMQEYINLNEHLFAIVSNGFTIRLLRDSSRLIKLSFLEFDLERMFNEDHFSDFAIMFRLLNASRMPAKQGEGSESLIEGYHQDSLDSGSRIREGLSNAVEHSIESIANGFLSHPANDELRQTIIEGNLSATEYYQHQLKFIYRLLFLMVIEERDLIFEKETPKEKRDIYYKYYSVNRIRNLSEKRYLAEAKYSDLWISLKNTFRLFETEYFGEKLEIKPLAGELFGSNAIGILNNCDLNNKILLECLKNLSVFTNPNTGQIMRVNYGSLNVEEFGSVYEGLLEYDPHLEILGNKITFSFRKGTGRSSSGSHYTPDELVQPLIKHSLDYIIEDKLKESKVASSQLANSEIVNRSISINEINLILGDDHGKNSILSGFDRVAKSYGSGGIDLRDDKEFSKGRNVRDDQSDAKSRCFNPSQYRRRLGEKLYERIHTFSKDRTRQSEGTGNPSADLRSGSSTQGSSDNYNYESQYRNWQDAAITYLQAQKPQTVLKLLPDSTRYILLANRSLLSITVCDVACGSGHILLNAARRIGNHLAKVRTGEDQPSPSAFRQAVRDVIQHCIYGVDKNPLAVELAKVALWLEAHNPGEPLNFLDHHIKCGDAIVGLAHKEELQNGIPDEAFKKLPDDDKDICKELRDRNKIERQYAKDLKRHYDVMVNQGIVDITNIFHDLDQLPEHTPQQIEAKRKKYKEITSGQNYWNLKLLADIMTAQFFIPKTQANQRKIITDAQYRNYLRGEQMIGEALGQTEAEAARNRFFHWFLEFPEVFSEGGFDCILGNPPYLGGKKIRGAYGDDYLQYNKYYYYPSIGQTDLIAFFIRRNYEILKQECLFGLITTNTIAEGDTRESSLEYITNDKANIVFAETQVKWPGVANLYVSLIAIKKGKWNDKRLLDKKDAEFINSYLSTDHLENPKPLKSNIDILFKGDDFAGEGFIIDIEEAKKLLLNPDNHDIVKQLVNGREVNDSFSFIPERYIINFGNLSEYEAKRYIDAYKIVEERVKPQRLCFEPINSWNKKVREFWWQFGALRVKMHKELAKSDSCFVFSVVTKHLSLIKYPSDFIFSNAVYVIAISNWYYFTFVQSSCHHEWSRKYCSKMKTDLRYSNINSFQTYPFPQNLSPQMETVLERIGKVYHEFRRQLMQKLHLGLTKTYNQFHNAQLTSEIVNSEIASRKELEKKFGKDTVYLWNHMQKTPGTCSMAEAIVDIIKLRQLHKAMDEAVLEAYGWGKRSEIANSEVASSEGSQIASSEVVRSVEESNRNSLIANGSPIDLKHDFYEVDYLPENDRVRYTISPEARKEVLKRLLLLNHKIYEEEVKKGLHNKKGKSNKQKAEKPQFMRKSIDLTKNKPKPKPESKHQLDLFSTISAPKPEILPTGEGILTSFHVGQHVFHNTFGEGEVLHIAGTGEFAKLTVKFGREMKKLVAGFAKLRGV